MVETARAYTKVARAAGEEHTRTALLDAAERAFFAGPWDEVSLVALADDAGVTKQTLLRHFGSKDGLLEQAYRRAFDRVREQRMSAPSDDVGAAIDNLLDHYEEHGDRARRIAAMELREPLAGLAQNARQLHYDWVDHAFATWLRALRGRRRARVRAALITLCDVQTWHLMRRDLELSRAETHASLTLAISRLLEEET